MALADLYRDDGVDYLLRRSDEILTEVSLPDGDGWRSTYWKLRRRGSFDFPVMAVAAAARFNADGSVEQARIVLGAVSSQPVICDAAAGLLQGQPLSEEQIAAAGKLAAKASRPMRNTDFDPPWRKQVIPNFVGYALRELRGDDMREKRLSIARHAL